MLGCGYLVGIWRIGVWLKILKVMGGRCEGCIDRFRESRWVGVVWNDDGLVDDGCDG